jgi:hypothetical protein
MSVANLGRVSSLAASPAPDPLITRPILTGSEVAEFTLIAHDKTAKHSCPANTRLADPTYQAGLCAANNIRKVPFLCGTRCVSPPGAGIGTNGTDVLVLDTALTMMIYPQDVNGRSSLQRPQTDMTASGLCTELKNLAIFKDFLRLVVYSGQYELQQNDPVVAFTRFSWANVIRVYSVRQHDIKLLGKTVTQMEFNDGQTVEDCQKQLGKKLVKSVFIVQGTTDAHLREPIFKIQQAQTIHIRCDLPAFEFQLPDGTTKTMVLDGAIVLNSLLGELQVPDAAFFVGDEQIDGTTAIEAVRPRAAVSLLRLR